MPSNEKKATEEFKENIDAWIKAIRQELSQVKANNSAAENSANIQHNYELICELRDEIENLKQEISALKIIQIINLKRSRI